MAQRTAGKVHWSLWLFAMVGITFIGMAVAPMISAVRKPAYERVGDEFVRALAKNQFKEAQQLTDLSALPEERRDFKKKWEERLVIWGEIEGVELIDSVPAPADLQHPRAAEGYRLEYHLKGYLTVGTAFVYVVPSDGDWKVVDYEFR